MIRYERAPYVDEIVMDSESVILLEHRAVRLHHLGTSIGKFLDRPRSLEQVAAELQELFGAPPDGDIKQATERALAILVDNGIVELADN